MSVREAIDRLRAVYKTMDGCGVYKLPPDDAVEAMHRDESDVLAWATYPPDDAEPITEEELEALLPSGVSHGGCGPWSVPLHESTLGERWELQIWAAYEGQRSCDIRLLTRFVPFQYQLDLPPIANSRGDVRRLLAALKPKETERE